MGKDDRGRKKAAARRGRSYPLEFKLRVMRAIVEGGQSVYGAAKAFGLGPTTVKDWVLRYEAKGGHAYFSHLDKTIDRFDLWPWQAWRLAKIFRAWRRGSLKNS